MITDTRIKLYQCYDFTKTHDKSTGFAVHGSGSSFTRGGREFDDSQLEKVHRIPSCYLQLSCLWKRPLSSDAHGSRCPYLRRRYSLRSRHLFHDQILLSIHLFFSYSRVP